MFPISDDNTGRSKTPFVNYALIAANLLVFIFFQQLGANQFFLMSFSTVPGEIISGRDIVFDESGTLGVTPIPVYATLLTSMFMHGGIGHIAGNMLYLWVFGDNLEDRMGHGRYLLFYLVCGLLASLSHVFLSYALERDLYTPSLGASGAISGVLGGYLLMFPKNEVRLLAFHAIISVPAVVSLGLWIVLQLISGIGMLGGSGGGGVAYAAHIGGFIAGLLLVKLFIRK